MDSSEKKPIDVRVEFADPPVPVDFPNDNGVMFKARTLARLIVNGEVVKVSGFPKRLTSQEKSRLTEKYVQSLKEDDSYHVVAEATPGPNRKARRSAEAQRRVQKRRAGR
jgi:hypothetical protein